jgi:hypothetical protein
MRGVQILLRPTVCMLVAAALLISAPVSAQTANEAAWYEFNQFEIAQFDAKAHVSGTTRGRWDKESGDVQLEHEYTDGGQHRLGRVMKIGGRIFAIQGGWAPEGSEADVYDSLAPLVQVNYKMLWAAAPGGIKSLKMGSTRVDYVNRNEGFEVGTASSDGYIDAPWRVQGRVVRDADDVLEYKLKLTSGVKGQKQATAPYFSVQYSGRVTKTVNARIDDATNLDGWKVFGVGIRQTTLNGHGLVDVGSVPAKLPFQTVGDVRRYLEREDDPGQPDTAQDFTGSWKKDCGEVAGLEIKRFANEGMYSIVFCNAAGCGDAAESRKTFITGDVHFEVIGDNEFIATPPGGEPARYHRCSRNPR